MRPRTPAAAVLLLFSLLVASPVTVRAEDTDDEEYDDYARVMRVSLIKGEVSLLRAGGDEWERVRLNIPLSEGDTVSTGADAHAELQLDAHNFVRLGENTVVRIAALRDEGVAVSITEGLAIIRLTAFDRARGYFEVDAPKTTVEFESAGLYRVEVLPDGSVGVTVRDDGRARVYSEDSGFDLRSGRSARPVFDGRGGWDWELGAAQAGDRWDAWNEERERHLAVRLRHEGRERYYDPEVWGAEELDNYGDWSYTRDYGYVWRPHMTVVNHYYNWAPYRYGRWVWCPPYGWTWVGDEEWGWAPYHYGRWVYVNNGWCWAPRGYGYNYRRARWRPALVAFVQVGVSRAEHIAWYPLGHGQRDPRGRYWRRGRERTAPPSTRLSANPALLRAVTWMPAREFGAAGGRARGATGEIARRALSGEPLSGGLPVVPAGTTYGQDRPGQGRSWSQAGPNRPTDSNATHARLFTVRPESVQPPRALPSRPTGATQRTPGAALGERLRRERVFNNRMPRNVTTEPDADGGQGGVGPSDRGVGGLRRGGDMTGNPSGDNRTRRRARNGAIDSTPDPTAVRPGATPDHGGETRLRPEPGTSPREGAGGFGAETVTPRARPSRTEAERPAPPDTERADPGAARRGTGDVRRRSDHDRPAPPQHTAAPDADETGRGVLRRPSPNQAPPGGEGSARGGIRRGETQPAESPRDETQREQTPRSDSPPAPRPERPARPAPSERRERPAPSERPRGREQPAEAPRVRTDESPRQEQPVDQL